MAKAQSKAPLSPEALVAEAAADANVPTPAEDERSDSRSDESTVTVAEPVKDANGIVVGWVVKQLPASVFANVKHTVTGGLAASPDHIVQEMVELETRKLSGLQAQPTGTGVNVTPVSEVSQ